MISTFRSKLLATLFRTGKTSKIDARMHGRILRRLDALNAARDVGGMDIPGFNFHPLNGFDPTRYSVHVNGLWCVTFAFVDGDALDVDYEQYH